MYHKHTEFPNAYSPFLRLLICNPNSVGIGKMKMAISDATLKALMT